MEYNIFSVQQNGLVPKFVDIDKDTLNIDCNSVEQAITEKTKAVFAVNLLGNSCELADSKRLCDNRGLVLIEDNCESSERVAKQILCYLGTAGTFSFFLVHLQTMEGGMIVTDDKDHMITCVVLEPCGWVRDIGNDSSCIQTEIL